MIVISKEEAEIIRERIPEAHIVRTMKQRSNRHRYYCEETRKVLNLVNNIRSPRPKTDGNRG